ncbi:tyrosine-protein phosphatase [Nonomuraea sp. KM88]|uniref:tyrosine-protein phosphatase n=1 Tax=Nonomuraea sp. KM88 TaxID=3457427 RepID=UPI003FCD9004
MYPMSDSRHAARHVAVSGAERRTTQRHLDWEGCSNVRDLAGIPVAGGGEIRPGAIVRSDNPESSARPGCPRCSPPWGWTTRRRRYGTSWSGSTPPPETP